MIKALEALLSAIRRWYVVFRMHGVPPEFALLAAIDHVLDLLLQQIIARRPAI